MPETIIEKNKRGKTGKYCPFREKNKCGDYCGLWVEGLKMCAIQAININLGNINNNLKILINQLDSLKL